MAWRFRLRHERLPSVPISPHGLAFSLVNEDVDFSRLLLAAIDLYFEQKGPDPISVAFGAEDDLLQLAQELRSYLDEFDPQAD